MPRRAYLILEALVLFAGVPLVYAVAGRGTPIVPGLMAIGAFSAWMLWRDPSFDRGVFRRWTRDVLPPLWLVALVAAVLLAAAWFARPHLMFFFPRTKPGLWALVMLAYPVLSALPQELAYRTFLLHRYSPLVPDRRVRIALSAVIFGLHHLLMGNWIAVLASTIGGLRFALVYERTRSIWAPAIEHAIYGCLIFTLGWGDYFYYGTIQFIEQASAIISHSCSYSYS